MKTLNLLHYRLLPKDCCSNPNVTTDPKNKTANNDTYPCVAFFIMYESSEKCNEETFFVVLHNQDVELEITSTKVRNHGKPDLETAARQLFQTVKDHNNATVQEMVDLSKTYCCQNAPASSSETEDKEEHEEFVLTHFPNCPSCFVIVNHDRCLQEFDNARQKLQSDRPVVETTLRTELDTCSSGTPSNDVISTICKVKQDMQSRRKIIIPQIHFDFNLIEVSKGFCYFQSSLLLFGNVTLASCHREHTSPTTVPHHPNLATFAKAYTTHFLTKKSV